MGPHHDGRTAIVELGIQLPAPPEPFGIYAEAVQTGNLLFLTGMLPTENQAPAFVGRVGAELDVETGGKRLAWQRATASRVVRQHLGSLDRVARVVRLGVAVATVGDVRDQAKVADGASELLQDVFGIARNPSPVGVRRREPPAGCASRTGTDL